MQKDEQRKGLGTFMKKEEQKNIWKVIWGMVVNRETIAYGIVGVLTTIINIISYHVFCNIIGIPNLTSNAIAWVIAVTFAYITNARLVFLSKREAAKEEAVKITKFYSARLISLGIEQLGLYVFVDIMGMYNLLVKAVLAVIVIILNYIFSKLYIFHK